MKIEAARKSDAGALVHLINIAGEGLPEYLWAQMCEAGEAPLSFGKKRAERVEGGFSFRNAQVVRVNEDIAGMLLSYRQDDPYDVGDPTELLEVVRPLVLLEAQAPGSWYINALAVHENYRRRGVARALMQEAEKLANENDVSSMSIIVSSENESAKALYTSVGYRIKAALPISPWGNGSPEGSWELMVKQLSE